MTILFTSDTHYFHRNIIKYSKRPYKSVEEMNESLVNNWNSVVKDEDEVYHLGDVGFAPIEKLGPLLKRLRGNKFLILGNHDNAKQLYPYFNWVKPYHELRVEDKDAKRGNQHIILFHYSCRVWNKSHHGSWQLYGHSHGTLFDDPTLLSTDVGVDPMRYYPVSYQQIKERFKTKTFKPIDHHGRED